MSSPSEPVVVSLFAGCGGSSLGYHLAGFRVALAVEWDRNAADCYRANFPGTQVYQGDIHDLSDEKALILAGVERGELDILDGSPPCQGFSLAGNRTFDDPRNQLFREYVRLIGAFRPKVLVMENVSGMVKGKMKLIFAEALRSIKAMGYRTRVKLMNAKFYGVPQSRQRLIFIGVREDLGIEPTYPTPMTRPVTAGEALRDLPERQGPPLALGKKALHLWACTRPGNTFADACERFYGERHYFNARRLSPSKPSCTITRMVTKSSGLFHWSEPRHMTIAELKRLQSLPDGFTLLGSYVEQYARIGNSVPPLLIKAIAEHVRTHVLEAADA